MVSVSSADSLSPPAAAAAVDAAGVTDFELRYHRAIPEWITGYAVMTAGPAAGA